MLRELDRGLISRHAFDANWNGPDGTLVSIVFRDKPDYRFEILQPETQINESGSWQTQECPAKYFTTAERYTHREFENARGALGQWANRLIEDLAVEEREETGAVEDFRRNLEQAADSLPNPDEPFSKEELKEWSQKLSGLIDRLERLEEENELQRGHVENLKRQFEELKKQGTKMPKRTWLKMAGHKILDVFEHAAKAGAKALAEGAVKAILDQTKGP